MSLTAEHGHCARPDVSEHAPHEAPLADARLPLDREDGRPPLDEVPDGGGRLSPLDLAPHEPLRRGHLPSVPQTVPGVQELSPVPTPREPARYAGSRLPGAAPPGLVHSSRRHRTPDTGHRRTCRAGAPLRQRSDRGWDGAGEGTRTPNHLFTRQGALPRHTRVDLHKHVHVCRYGTCRAIHVRYESTRMSAPVTSVGRRLASPRPALAWRRVSSRASLGVMSGVCDGARWRG